ncbi:MAG: glucuronate isomerase [Clostridia bacterium]|nr:glucuronate isomerase [Clostridia bacterium]
MRFMDRDFLLDTHTAQKLYHTYAEAQPIFDYHNHLSPKNIAEHRRFHDLTELWLEGDHYKWRAMRANGVEEKYITGDTTPYEKFAAWAGVMPKLVGCPLYHWTHLELQRYFGIDEPLTPDSAKRIWDQTRDMVRGEGFDAVSLLKKAEVRVLCTTDDPADTLEWHKKIAVDDSIPFRVCPSFRPDRYLAEPEGAAAKALCEKYGTDDLNAALEKALDYFAENGCLVSDHGFSAFPYRENAGFSALLRSLGKAYAQRGVVMQLHLGPIRNVSPRLFGLIGADAGGDSVGLTTNPYDLAAFLGDLERENALPRTILYNLNPADNRMLATMAADFAPTVQFGAAWWLNDHLRGIEAQLQELMETGALGASVGMLTDSRSFTSFVRHEYFRRILCRVLGRIVENGLYPADAEALGMIVSNVCYCNAERFFQSKPLLD